MRIAGLVKKIIDAQRALPLLLVISSIPGAGLFMPHTVQAVSFTALDARSAAMGGVGVATHARNAAYYNPALLATHYEDFDAIGLFPVHAESTVDPDSVESGLDRLHAASESGDSAGVQSALVNLTDDIYNDTTINSAAIIVPSTTIGATGFVNSYKYTSAKTDIGVDVNSSTLEHRSLNYMEIGAGVGKQFGEEDSVFGLFRFGLTAKILLFESYGYTEAIDSASLGLDSSKIRRDSMINFDFGVAKEVGVWKIGLVVRNLVSDDIKYGASTNKFNIGPQARLGLAYASRRTIAELDIDITTNEGVGFEEDSAYVAAGLEFKLLPRLYLRGGIRQNRAGDSLTTGTFGIGIDFWGVLLDVAGQSSKEEQVVLINIASSF